MKNIKFFQLHSCTSSHNAIGIPIYYFVLEQQHQETKKSNKIRRKKRKQILVCIQVTKELFEFSFIIQHQLWDFDIQRDTTLEPKKKKSKIKKNKYK